MSELAEFISRDFVDPPVHYRKADGTTGHIDGPEWPWPEVVWTEDGIAFVQETLGDDAKWIHMGFAPAPTSRFQLIKYHLGMGLAAGYPVKDVLSFTWRYGVCNKDD